MNKASGRSGRPSFFLELTLLLGSTMTVMAGATIAPALPQIYLYFQDAPQANLLVKLLLSVHALFIAICAPVMGILMDRYGRKPILIFSTTLFGLAGGSGYLLNSLWGIIAGRALLGVAVAGIMSGFTTLIGDYFTDEKRNKLMGLQAAFAGFGGLVFMSAGGFLADFGWRYPFLIYLFAFVVLPGVIVFLYEPGLGEKGPDNAPDTNAPQPRPPVKLIYTVYFLAFWGMLVFYLIPVQLPFYLKSLGDVSNTRIGVAIGLMNLVGALSSMQFKKIRARLSPTRIYMIFALLMGAGYLTIFLAGSYGLVVLGLMISGLGFGLLMPNVNVWVVSLVQPAVRGKFVGGLTTFFLLGQFVSPCWPNPWSEKSASATATA